MSTKSDIIYCNGTYTRVYHETNQKQYAFDKFLGFDIECSFDFADVKEITFNDGILNMDVVPNSELHTITGANKITLYGTDLSGIEIDKDGIVFTIKGGSFSARIIESGAYTPKNYSNQNHNHMK